MKQKKYIITTIKSWNIKEAKKFISKNLDLKLLLITDKEELTYEKIENFNPGYIFFSHWSWIIPSKIYKNYECIVFHMTDLPFGRGGSPLQNLIARGIPKTKITAIKVVKELDAGPIYLKQDLSLKGSATQIFQRASKIIFEDMIPHIIKNKSVPMLQKGRVTKFRRRTSEQSNIINLKSLKKVSNYIRMLDAEGYPQAFIETPNFKIEFSKVISKKNCVLANAKISIKEKK